MALPTLDKSYLFNVNQLYTSTGTLLSDCRQLMLGMKNSLKGFAGSAAWSILGSSNGTSAGLDTVDRWSVIADLNWSTTSRSWLVTKPGGTAGLQLCIDLNVSNSLPQRCSIVVSPSAGFTGGTLPSARPTATDEIVLLSSADWINGSAVTSRLHVIQSTDGHSTTIITCQANALQNCWHFSTPKNPIAGWTNPNISIFQASSVMSVSSWHRAANFKGRIGSVSASFGITGETYNNLLIGENMSFADEQTGEWPFGPMGLYGVTNGARGRKGTLYDMYWGTTIASIADNYPDVSPLYQWAQFGSVIVPWNQTAPLAA